MLATFKLKLAAALLALAGMAAACGPAVVKLNFEREAAHVSYEQQLLVQNMTNQALSLLPASREGGAIPLPPGETMSVGFEVYTVVQKVPLEGGTPEASVFPAKVSFIVATTEPAILVMISVGQAGLAVVTADGSEWSFRFNVAECPQGGWKAEPAPSADHPLEITGRPSILPEPLCPRR